MGTIDGRTLNPACANVTRTICCATACASMLFGHATQIIHVGLISADVT